MFLPLPRHRRIGPPEFDPCGTDPCITMPHGRGGQDDDVGTLAFLAWGIGRRIWPLPGRLASHPPLVLLCNFDYLVDAGLERIEVGKRLDFLANADHHFEFLQLDPDLLQRRQFVGAVVGADDQHYNLAREVTQARTVRKFVVAAEIADNLFKVQQQIKGRFVDRQMFVLCQKIPLKFLSSSPDKRGI